MPSSSSVQFSPISYCRGKAVLIPLIIYCLWCLQEHRQRINHSVVWLQAKASDTKDEGSEGTGGDGGGGWDAHNMQNLTIHQSSRIINFKSISGLRAIVTGLEHSGTTVFSNILFNAPCVIGAIETGYLLAKSPADIKSVQPWFEWHQSIGVPRCYGLSTDDHNAMMKAHDFAEMYHILQQRSQLFNGSVIIDKEYCKKPFQIIDKTPRYIYPKYFDQVLAKTPGVPCIVLKKNFDSLESSWLRRHRVLHRVFYQRVYDGVYEMQRKYPNRIMVVEYSDLSNHTEDIMQEAYAFLGLKWDPSYLNMTGLLNKLQAYPEAQKSISNAWSFTASKHTNVTNY